MELARLFEAGRLPGWARLLPVAVVLMFAQGGGIFAADERRAEPAMACPSTNFQEFLEIFAESEAVQRAFTKTPLITLSIDPDANPNPVRVVNMLEYWQIKFPVFPPARERAERSITFQVHGVLVDRHATVDIVNSTGRAIAIMSYYFSKDDCWRLILVNPRTQ
jgi:hypothetical protein